MEAEGGKEGGREGGREGKAGEGGRESPLIRTP